VKNLTGATVIAGGFGFSLAIKNNKTVWAWGDDTYGKLGQKRIFNILTPTNAQINEDIGYDRYDQTPVSSLNVGTNLTFDGTVVSKTDENWYAVKAMGDLSALISLTGATDNLCLDIFDSTLNYISSDKTSRFNLKADQALYFRVTFSSSADYQETAYALTVSGVKIGEYGLDIDAISGRTYLVNVNAMNIQSITEHIFILTYDPNVVSLVDFAGQTPEADVGNGTIPRTELTIISNDNGIVTFSLTKTVPNGKLWSGTVTILKFISKTSINTNINLNSGALTCTVKSMSAKIAKPLLIPYTWTGLGDLEFTSSNAAVCSVSANGTLTPLKVGTTVITIITPDGVKNVFAVTVTA